MRPVRLEMHGFASFRDETIVDFVGADFFALIGPTGSGKSTVIDAMVFALYGSAPRWGRANTVQYALAPTTPRATVRLVFDVGPHRYQVAREVRRTGQSIQQKMAVLERFDNASSLEATSDEVQTIASEVRDVTPAVETLLGLSFDDFTKAVVLPQGRFAEFLAATVGDRQEILLKLLGAHQYDVVMRAASARKRAAEGEANTINGRIEELGGVSQDDLDAAQRRASALSDLAAQVGRLLVELEGAQRQCSTAIEREEKARADVARLSVVQMPEGVAGLAQRAAAVRAEAQAAHTAASGAERAFDRAHAELLAGGNRTVLERARDGWIEVSELRERLPALRLAAEAASTAAEHQIASRQAAEDDWSAAFATEAAAQRASDEADATLASVTQRHRAVIALQAPPGLDDLAERLDAVVREQSAAAAALAGAETAEDEARHALSKAGDPSALNAVIARCDTAIALDAKISALTLRNEDASMTLGEASVVLEQAQLTLAEAQRQADEARARITSATLRAHLTSGDACPVCESTVMSVPGAIDVADAESTVARVRTVERAANSARDDVTRAEARVASEAKALAEARAQRAEAVGTSDDPVAIRDQARTALEAINVAKGLADEAAAARSQARAASQTAQARADSLADERRAGFAALRAARTNLLAYGAPVAESDSLHESWRELIVWAADSAETIAAVDLPHAQAAHAAATTAHADARARLESANVARTQASSGADAANTAHLAADAALEQSLHREHALATQLKEERPAADIDAELTALDGLEKADADTYNAVLLARRNREAADDAQERLAADLAQAGSMLTTTREPLIALGAPPVDPSDLPTAWAELSAWAQSVIPLAEATVQEAVTEVATARAAISAAEGAVVAETTAGGVEVSSASGAEVAIATALARANDSVDLTRRDLARVATLQAQRAESMDTASVAGMLAEHLNAKKFQRWLAGAALDVLVEAASSSLLELSAGQFSLTHDKGEFYVIDHTDAEARRSVRTLSGGETFQASLALALALSAELSTMSSNAARLDSIFLDEGFGSLDPESLDVVAVTLERLAQGDRMVGVITHVASLADRIPTRFQVARTTRSSVVSREG